MPLYHTARFAANDYEDFRRIRLEALQREPGVFSSNYERELAFDAAAWIQRLQNPDAAFFGLYRAPLLVGLTGITGCPEAPGNAVLIASYIQRSCRGQGLSALLYEARIAWARASGFQRLIVSHRKDNGASAAAIRHAGFIFTHETWKRWPDGVEAAEVFYSLDLR